MIEEIENLIKTRYKRSMDYNEVLSNIRDIVDFYKYKYYYLKFKDEVLLKLIYDALKDNINKEFMIPQVYAQVESRIEYFIRKKLQSKDMLMVDLVLKDIIMNVGNNKIKILRDFYLKLTRYGVIFNEEYFLLVKSSSKVFREIINSCGIKNMSYIDFKNIINHKYDFYFKVRPPFKSLNWTIRTFNYINEMSYKKINYLSATSEQVYKVRYIMINYDNIDAVKKLYLSFFRVLEEKELDRVIFNLDIKSLEKILEDYKVYQTGFKESANIPDFILRLYSKLKARNVNTSINNNRERLQYIADNAKIFKSISELYKRYCMVSIDKELEDIDITYLKRWVKYYQDGVLINHLDELYNTINKAKEQQRDIEEKSDAKSKDNSRKLRRRK